MEKINNFLFSRFALFQEFSFFKDQKRLKQSQLDYSQAEEHWNDNESKVHSNIGDTAISKMSIYIKKIMGVCKDDIVLDVGCGDGLIDSKFVDVKKLYGFDFSEGKIQNAKNMNKQVKYWTQSFLNPIQIDGERPNKVFSFSVMQYCKESDLDDFLSNQIEVLADGAGSVYCIDVPDVDKAFFFYSRSYPKIPAVFYKRRRKKLKNLFADGSYWTDMKKVKEILQKIEEVKEVTLEEGFSDYRTTIVIRCEKRNK